MTESDRLAAGRPVRVIGGQSAWGAVGVPGLPFPSVVCQGRASIGRGVERPLASNGAADRHRRQVPVSPTTAELGTVTIEASGLCRRRLHHDDGQE